MSENSGHSGGDIVWHFKSEGGSAGCMFNDLLTQRL